MPALPRRATPLAAPLPAALLAAGVHPARAAAADPGQPDIDRRTGTSSLGHAWQLADTLTSSLGGR